MSTLPYRHLETPNLRVALERIYPVPRDTRSLDDWDRRRHLDLPSLNEFALWRDHERVVHRLRFETDRGVIAWLSDRLRAIGCERRRRHATPQASPPSATAPVATVIVASGAALNPVRGGGRRGR